MKISLFDRILLSLLALLVIALAVLAFMMGTHLIPLENVLYTAELPYASAAGSAVFIGVAALVFLLGIKLLFARQPRQRQSAILLKSTPNGNIFLSISAIDEMAQRYIKSLDKVRDAKVIVCPQQAEVGIKVRLSVMPETVIPELIVSLQTGLKEYVQTYSGVTVSDVGILVENTEASKIQ
ncbi:MAG: alkaline shock response membrane anchor protein AmaP [Christensenellales bacterium]|jgi:hypothetical protein